MALFHSHFHSVPPPSPCSSSNPKPKPKPKPKLTLPARDTPIDFGRHKGRPLGSLPSSYLTWISSNLRAAESLHWAHLADQVLSDPVYRDRIEWEFAQNLLSGNNSSSNSSRTTSVVSELLEVSQRFGWDNDDKAGWARVDFELLGTSKGSRIPRISRNTTSPRIGDDEEVRVERRVLGGKREERRERRSAKLGVEEANEGRLEMMTMMNKSDGNGVAKNPFPGRGALLDKIHKEGE